MLEPYVLKGTRTVPRRGEMSNHLFLFDKTPNKQVAQKNKSRNPRLLQSRGSSIEYLCSCSNRQCDCLLFDIQF